MLQLGVAKELGYTLNDLKNSLNFHELLIWASYFELLNDDQERRLKQSRYR